MYTELTTVTDPNNQDVLNTSYSGGTLRGQCLQMTQANEHGSHFVQLTKSQGIQQMAIMQMWLNRQ
jgi:hypothetical protein